MMWIYRCTAGHFFLSETCPFCGQSKVQEIEYRSGDCIRCGNLCPEHAYGCNENEPSTFPGEMDGLER